MSLACPSCRDRLTVGEIVQAVSTGLAEERLVDFRCPLCGERGLARLSDGLVEIGRPTGPGFKVLSFEVALDLAVASRKDGLAIWHRGEQRLVPEREECMVVPAPPPRTPAA